MSAELVLTASAQATVDRLRKHRDTLIDNGFLRRNAIDRVLHDNGDVDANLAALALNLGFDPNELQRKGFTA